MTELDEVQELILRGIASKALWPQSHRMTLQQVGPNLTVDIEIIVGDKFLNASAPMATPKQQMNFEGQKFLIKSICEALLGRTEIVN